jgi:hypothetical protein
MSPSEIRDYVERRVAYKPGWKIRLDEVPLGSRTSLSLHVSFTTEDTWNPGRTTLIGMRFPLDAPVRDAVQLDHLVLDCLDQCERHETREWLKIDGVARFDPHHDG